jgi:hypothetical protein
MAEFTVRGGPYGSSYVEAESPEEAAAVYRQRSADGGYELVFAVEVFDRGYTRLLHVDGEMRDGATVDKFPQVT